MQERTEDLDVLELIEIAHQLARGAAQYRDWADDDINRGHEHSARQQERWAERCERLEKLFDGADRVTLIIKTYDEE